MSFLYPYHESEPRKDQVSSHDLAFIALGILGTLQFEWDWGNLVNHDTQQRHNISKEEIEEAITNKYRFLALIKKTDNLKIVGDENENQEERFLLFSQLALGKIMKVVFTCTDDHPKAIRPITAFYITEEEGFKLLSKNGYNKP